MTASRLMTIFCDAPSCGQWEDAGIAPTAREARAQLAGRGWRLGVTGNARTLEDYCPAHASPHSGDGDR